MPIAINHRHGIRLATMRGAEAIPEIGSETTRLNDMSDVHFGINSDSVDGDIDRSIDSQKDLLGLGPRILDICNRGGRTAEDTWRILGMGYKPSTYRGVRRVGEGEFLYGFG